MRTAAFLLAPKNFDGRIAQKLREKEDTLSLKVWKSAAASDFLSSHVLVFGSIEEDNHYCSFVFF